MWYWRVIWEDIKGIKWVTYCIANFEKKAEAIEDYFQFENLLREELKKSRCVEVYDKQLVFLPTGYKGTNRLFFRVMHSDDEDIKFI